MVRGRITDRARGEHGRADRSSCCGLGRRRSPPSPPHAGDRGRGHGAAGPVHGRNSASTWTSRRCSRPTCRTRRPGTDRARLPGVRDPLLVGGRRAHPERARAAALLLRDRLARETTLHPLGRRAGRGARFFEKNGLLYLPTDELARSSPTTWPRCSPTWAELRRDLEPARACSRCCRRRPTRCAGRATRPWSSSRPVFDRLARLRSDRRAHRPLRARFVARGPARPVAARDGPVACSVVQPIATTAR